MKPVNIYRVSRICDEVLFNISEKHESSDYVNHRTPIHEINSLRILVDAMMAEGVDVIDTDGFYFGFIIPQIGKEFDLVKVTGKYCLNIELKSQDVTEEQIVAQLRKNRHYLTLLGRELMLFTVVTNTLTCYKLTDDDRLERTKLKDVVRAVKRCRAAYHGRIDKLFRASEYLISPEKNPSKFLQKQYFLSPAQDYVKSELLKAMPQPGTCAFYHITGRPCSGKTLLLYDLAAYLSEKGRTLVISMREPEEGLKVIDEALELLTIMASSEISSTDMIKDFDYVLVDESLRLRNSVFDMIRNAAEQNGQICIFSTDPSAILTNAEREQDIIGRIQSLGLAGEYSLTEKIRMNMELHTFLMKLMHLEAKIEKTYDFDHVSVNYANNVEEARRLIGYFKEKKYTFINPHIAEDDPFADLEEDFSNQHIAGREYDRVVMLMDSSFYYDSEGYLKGIPEPDPELLYPNLFYHGITRVRELLAIVVLEDQELLRSVLSIIG